MRHGFALAIAIAPVLAPGAAAQCETGKITAATSASSDEVGSALSIDGEVAVVGAHYNDVKGQNAGSAHVLQRQGATWSAFSTLHAADGSAGDLFGDSVSVSGMTAAIGAPRDDDAGESSGSVYVFEREGDLWVQVAKLKAADGAPSDELGTSVALEVDTLLAGAPGHGGTGAVYVWTRVGKSWIPAQKLVGSDSLPGDGLGSDLGLDGSRAVAGAPGKDAAGPDSGGAYVFEAAGGPFVETARLHAADAAAGDRFGVAVDVDGATIVAGADRDDAGASDSGSAYVFELSGASWSEVAKLAPSDPGIGDAFGSAVTVQEDAVVVGAWFDEAPYYASGSAYVFRDFGAGWSQTAKLTPAAADPKDTFGLAVEADGDSLFVSCPLDDDHALDAGAVYVYAIDDCPTLFGAPATISIATGGTQSLSLGPVAPPLAGLPYLLLGTVSGTSPGLALDGVPIPLNVDAYTLHTLQAPNAPPLTGSFGVLAPGTGTSTATFTLPAGLSGSLAGTTVHHAFVVIELLPTLLHLAHVSNPVAVDLVP